MKNGRNFHPDWDISTYKRPNYCILRSEHSAHRSMLRKKPKTSQNAILLRYFRKMTVTSIPIEIFRRVSGQLTASYGQNIVHTVVCFATSPTTRKTQSFYDIVENDRTFHPYWDISTFTRPNYCILLQNIVHTVACFETRPPTRRTRSFVDFDAKCP
jgi:hypothetical protein